LLAVILKNYVTELSESYHLQYASVIEVGFAHHIPPKVGEGGVAKAV
jgi:hypothetical protein